MKYLNIILWTIYPILIIILLLLHSCEFREEGVSDQSENIVRQAQEVGSGGDLKVTLLWSFKGDIDLHVRQPNGYEIYFHQPKDTRTGGFLDVDNTHGGVNSAENIYWENPPKGEYSVSLVYYQASTDTRETESGVCSVVVFQQGKSPQKYEVRMKNVKDKKDVVKINFQ